MPLIFSFFLLIFFFLFLIKYTDQKFSKLRVTKKEIFVSFSYAQIALLGHTLLTIYKMPMSGRFFDNPSTFDFNFFSFSKTNAGLKSKFPENANFFYNQKLLCTGNSILRFRDFF